jgi:phosphorylcholine metabolism protein LicD|tara:strand:- start:610 stop:858 length:249 start_codon:yes stop_codon:yes gene_type:complete
VGVKKTVVSYTYTPSDFKAYQWCVNNGIYISPFCKENFAWWYIDIEINKKINRSPQAYNPRELWETIFKYYKYYYDKYEQKI